MINIEAVIFACFGVFVNSNFKEFCAKHTGNDQQKLKAIGDLDDRACLGEITHEKLVYEISRICHITIEEASSIISHDTADIQLLRYVRDELYPIYIN